MDFIGRHYMHDHFPNVKITMLDLPLSGTRAEFVKMALDKATSEVSVYARVAPEHKLKIVESLQRQGNIVAMIQLCCKRSYC